MGLLRMFKKTRILKCHFVLQCNQCNCRHFCHRLQFNFQQSDFEFHALFSRNFIQLINKFIHFLGRAIVTSSDDLHLFPRVKIPRNLFPRGFLQGTNVARHLFSKGNGFPSGAIPRVSNSKGIDLHVLHIPREHFPRPNFQGPISKVQFPRPNFQVPISKSQFPTPF